MKVLVPVALLASLCGCLHVPERPKEVGGELITIETDAGFCNGDCTGFDIRVASDGRGLLRVHHNDQLMGLRGFRLTPTDYDSFRDKLASYRPVGDRFFDDSDNSAGCDQFATDLGGYHVTWVGGGPTGRLGVNDGCIGTRAEAARTAVRTAVAMLGFRQLPDPSGGVVASTLMPGKR